MPADPELERWLDTVLAEVDADFQARLASAPPVIVAIVALAEELMRKEGGHDG